VAPRTRTKIVTPDRRSGRCVFAIAACVSCRPLLTRSRTMRTQAISSEARGLRGPRRNRGFRAACRAARVSSTDDVTERLAALLAVAPTTDLGPRAKHA
jgi:hypothetical protein